MPNRSSRAHRTRGTYTLVIHLSRAQTIRVGALSEFKFPRGYYLYVGSAMNGLAQRLARHVRPDKKMHWHIDYLLAHGRIKEVWAHRSEDRLECLWAQAALAMPGARVIAPRFGASDCSCATHLIYFAKRPMNLSDD
ncbi:MAG: GIY-YIG nuclease family protein [Chloroflexi bacterium]|nr:GIY-YIG nuclease family protein [Chloroflexota bacterium]